MNLIKKATILIIGLLLSSCTTSRLEDKALNSFIATATQGEPQDKVQVKWITTPFYKNYTVFRSESENGIYAPITQRISAGLFEDTSIAKGKEYFYKVQGYNDLGTPMHTTESTLGYAGDQSGFYPPSNIKINSGVKSQELTLTWDRARDAVSYRIQKLDIKNNFTNYIELGTTPLLHFTDKGTKDSPLKIGETYIYRIFSIGKDGNPSQNASEFIKGTLFGGSIGLRSSADLFSNKIRIEWNALQYAKTYMVFRSLSAGDLGTSIDTVVVDNQTPGSKMIYDDDDLESGQAQYYYTIIFSNDDGVPGRSAQVRGYISSDSAPTKVQNFVATKGTDPRKVILTWNTVTGAQGYDIERSSSASGPWSILTNLKTVTRFEDTDLPTNSYFSYYRINAVNPVPGPASDIQQGWANRPPLNIQATTFLGDRVNLVWDSIPNATRYSISASDSLTGVFNFVGSVDAPRGNTATFNHYVDIGTNQSKDLYYKISVTSSAGSSSIDSEAVKGRIFKIAAPQNFVVQDNKTPTKSMRLRWTSVSGATTYKVYRALLDTKDSSPSRLKNTDFKEVATVDSSTYSISFTSYPIRRYVYRVAAVDPGGAVGTIATSDVVYRLPVDALDFAKDIDFTIIEAQTQIGNFGGINSGGTIYGRASGRYEQYSGLSGSKSEWYNYNSFEVILDGKQTVSVSGFGASLNGPMYVKGIYSGVVTYNALYAGMGGFVQSGSITFTYNHPTQGAMTQTWNHVEADGHLESVFQNAGGKPGKPQYEQGAGN